MRKKAQLFLCLLLLVCLFAARLTQSALAGAIPESFELFLTAPGVTVYGNETTDEAHEYVQVLDLSSGAHLDFWHGDLLPATRGVGLFGGASPRFERHYLPDVWLALSAGEPNIICLINGQFFRDTVNSMWVNPTELAFPLKHDGVIVSEGYERRRFRSQRVMLELWDDHAAISPLSRHAFYSSSAPDIIAGLQEQARVRPTEELGRTLVGAGDIDGDGANERLYIYSGAAATQAHAAAVLRAFGARELMWLDGGGSAQLSCDGASFIHRIRPLPQMIATISATAAQARAVDQHLTLFEKMLERWLRLLDPQE